MATGIAERWCSLRMMAAITLCAVSGLGGLEAAPADNQVTLDAPFGQIVGTASADVVAFKGIPYAAPPVGDLRWKAPLPLAVQSPLDATEFASHCPQENAPDDPAADEDCLYLNVFAPAGALREEKSKPVMVWIHGGANANGASDFYDPTVLVANGDVMVVTLNYRLGALGFLAHPDLQTDADDPVNLGLLDQQLALEWVHDNIAAFGGDPDNVTIFGESAGGLNVTAHLVSDGSEGLFHKAIIQSGGYLLETPSLQDARAKGTAFARRIGCADEKVADCLRSKSVAGVLANQGKVNTDSAAYHQMVEDGVVLKRTQAAALYTGKFHHVPLMIGSTRNEGRFFYAADTTEEAYMAAVQGFSIKNSRKPDWTMTVYARSSYDSPMAAAAAVLGDAEFSCPALRSAFWASLRVPTYLYEFSDPDSLRNSGHFSDIYYLFKFKDERDFGIYGPDTSNELAEFMQAYWIAFAYSGDPNKEDFPVWPRFRPDRPSVQFLATSGIQSASVHDEGGFVDRHNCDYWGGSLNSRFSDRR